jgi:para-aminobenzoate synthetase component I
MINVNRSPLIEKLRPGIGPDTLFELFRQEPYPFFLDSAMDPVKLGRYSFMGSRPFLRISSWGNEVAVIRDNHRLVVQGNPFDIIGTYLEQYKVDPQNTGIPCSGGAVGYFSYDLCHFIEKLPSKAVDDLKLPECNIGFYDMVLAEDNLNGDIYIISTGFPETEDTKRIKRAEERIKELKSRIAGCLPDQQNPATIDKPPAGKPVLTGNFTREGYLKAVEKARQYIIDGDIFEVNLSQRFETGLALPPYELYRRLRKINPAPFSAYLEFDEVTIASASPERFLRRRGDYVETRPIKGTIRRGRTSEEDEANKNILLNSIKDRAENVMIVDLERNDLGRVCRYGTVKVTELAILEEFPTVFHLTSTITGRLNDGINHMELLKATFPGGSITGAPKVRSMEIIDELEPTRRSVYTGIIGYLGFDGTMDTNIVIRTFLIKGNKAYFQLGGAVVFDSNAESEYEETLDKGRALINALSM